MQSALRPPDLVKPATIKDERQEVWPYRLPTDTRAFSSTMLLHAILCGLALASSASFVDDNEIIGSSSRSISNSEELLSAVVGDCFTGSDNGVSSMSCLRLKVLTYLDSVIGVQEARSLEENDAEVLDAMILSRVTRYLKSHQFKVNLPEFLFQEAVLTFRPGKSLTDFKVEFPKPDANEDRAITEGKFVQ
jgi:hypothetical protein